MVINTVNSRDFYNEKASEVFDEKVRDELLERLEEIREDILVRHGFYFNFEDVYLRKHNEMVINIY